MNDPPRLGFRPRGLWVLFVFACFAIPLAAYVYRTCFPGSV